MNNTTLAILSVGIPAVISIVGFVITIFTLKKNFQNELVKQKANVQLEKMDWIFKLTSPFCYGSIKYN